MVSVIGWRDTKPFITFSWEAVFKYTNSSTQTRDSLDMQASNQFQPHADYQQSDEFFQRHNQTPVAGHQRAAYSYPRPQARPAPPAISMAQEAKEYGPPPHEHHWQLPPRPRVRSLTPIKAHMVAAMGEFVAIFLWLFFGYGSNIVAANQASARAINGATNTDTVLFIALAFAIPLMVNIWASFRISGGHLNPAVTLGACIAGGCEWKRGGFMVSGQLFGSIAAGFMAKAVWPGDVVKANNTLGNGATVIQGLIMEMLFAAQLVTVVLHIPRGRPSDVLYVPLGVGLSLFGVMLAGVSYSGGSANPARSFGCSVASFTFPGYHWIYWMGPLSGGALAAAYYRLAKYLKELEARGEGTKDRDLEMSTYSRSSSKDSTSS